MHANTVSLDHDTQITPTAVPGGMTVTLVTASVVLCGQPLANTPEVLRMFQTRATADVH